MPGIQGSTALLSTSYLGPVQYYSKFLIYDRVLIEQYDHYSKQTYRNRCRIQGANGSLQLTVPVKKPKEKKAWTRDILIDYDKNWRKLHWKSIESAYNSSPFFEFYADYLEPFYQKKFEYLVDLNTQLMDMILQQLGKAPDYSLSTEYQWNENADYSDFREIIHPKKDLSLDPEFRQTSYQQVFRDKNGFLPNLSIIDLLFNLGPEARDHLI